MTHDRYFDGVLRERWDDTARQVTFWDAAGVLIPSTPEAPNPRPYNPDENAAADARALAETFETNRTGLEGKLSTSLGLIKTELGANTDLAGYTSVRAMQNKLAALANADALTVRDGKAILGWVEKAYVNLLRVDRRLLEQYDTQGE